MARLDLFRRHLLPSAAAAGMLLGTIVGLFLPIRAATPPKAGTEAWSLPGGAETSRFREDAYATLRSARFWSNVETPGRRSAPRMEWSLTAIITRPMPMAAITLPSGTQATNLVPVGSNLPDGSTLARVSRDAVWFEKDGCLRERRLYRPVTAENNACIGSAPETADPSASPLPNNAAQPSTARVATPPPSAPRRPLKSVPPASPATDAAIP